MTPQKRTALRKKLQTQLDDLRQIKADAAILERDRKSVQASILEGLGSLSLDSFSYEDGEGIKVKATRVQATSLVIDESQLKKSLGATMWNKITRRVLDSAKLEDAIAEGKVDPVDVAQASSENKNAPYVKVTEKAPKKGRSADEDKF